MNTNIENIINDVGSVITNGINKLMYEYQVQYLTTELEKCKSEMEYYKNELEKIKKDFTGNKENIVLEIYDDIYNKSGVTKSTIDNFFCLSSKNIIVSKKEQDKSLDEESVSSLEEEEEAASLDEDEDEEVASLEEDSVASLDEDEEVASLKEEDSVASLEEQEQETVANLEEEAVANLEEEEVFEIEIDDITYYTENEENGNIYSVDENGEPGDKIGYLKEGEPFFD